MQTWWRCDGRIDVRLSLGYAGPSRREASSHTAAHTSLIRPVMSWTVMLEPRLRRLETWRGSRRQTGLYESRMDRGGQVGFFSLCWVDEISVIRPDRPSSFHVFLTFLTHQSTIHPFNSQQSFSPPKKQPSQWPPTKPPRNSRLCSNHMPPSPPPSPLPLPATTT